VLSRGRLNVLRWTVASAVGMGGGLLLGAAVVDYGTSLRDLVLMGALTGVVLGAAQAIVLPVARVAWRVLWPLIVAGLWALGWTLTTLGGIDVDQQWSVVGSFGAITVTALMGLVLALTSTDRGNSFRP
jgi:hypothetical protein